ncbi:hypothetical protein DES53_108231 [Roseimicrobium gellanilyticum]|uniref:Uncharacterized protein n=1 Tax=Roseimicrobium gellanilyticum TaxID=748857 RepID=A0A366HFR8_9BACT|nr:hypothetical protein [Roseimicrobium gellanilyticum]RBP40524.1 hypothetical protein DES53_108231 [Roseimicrobium gellanilyticum]
MPHTLRITLLWLCTALFLARVMGQILVGVYHTPLLPEWKEWYSGLLPYPWLLLSQLLLLMFMTVVNVDTARRSGRFHVVSTTARGWLKLFAALYAGSMVVRYAYRMVTMPEERWFGGTIPIWFHFVLAAWVWLVGMRSPSSTSEKH